MIDAKVEIKHSSIPKKTIQKEKKKLFQEKLSIFEKTKKELLQNYEKQKKNLDSTINYIKQNVLKREEEKTPFEVFHKKMVSGPLKGFTLCTDVEFIFNDIQKRHSGYNNFGIFYNNEGRAMQIYEFTSCGYSYMCQGSSESRFTDPKKNGFHVGIRDLHFYNEDDFNAIINNCDIEDRDFDYESELKLLIISICEYGFMYLPKKTLSGKSQYKGDKVVNEDEEEEKEEKKSSNNKQKTNNNNTDEENSKEKDLLTISNNTIETQVSNKILFDKKKTLNESQIVDTKTLNFTKE